MSLNIRIFCTFLFGLTMASDLHMNVTAETDDLPVAQPFVDIVISDYFRTERMLWQRIDNRADNILLQVYKTHETFFDRVINQCGSGVSGRDLIPSLDALVSIIANINGTAELGQTHLKEQTLDKQSITEYAQTGLKVLKDASNLYDFSMKDSFWAQIISHLTNCHGNGDTVESSHQVVYDLYKDIQSSFLKSYITAQMSYMILGYYSTGENYSEQLDILRATFKQRFIKLREISRRYLKQANKIVWKCDTVVNNVFSSWTEISNFLQGIVDNESNLNSAGSCAGACSDFLHTNHYQCQSGSLCDRAVNDHDPIRCTGIIRNCQEIDDASINICETADPNRRYNYIKYSDGRAAGNLSSVCHGRLRTILHAVYCMPNMHHNPFKFIESFNNNALHSVFQAESWIRWFVKCSNCICLCDDVKNKRSERFFSLREVVSDIADNKVVTGVVLTKQNGVIHMEIAERTLLPYGQVDALAHDFYETWKTSNAFNHHSKQRQ